MKTKLYEDFASAVSRIKPGSAQVQGPSGPPSKDSIVEQIYRRINQPDIEYGGLGVTPIRLDKVDTFAFALKLNYEMSDPTFISRTRDFHDEEQEVRTFVYDVWSKYLRTKGGLYPEKPLREHLTEVIDVWNGPSRTNDPQFGIRTSSSGAVELYSSWKDKPDPVKIAALYFSDGDCGFTEASTLPIILGLHFSEALHVDRNDYTKFNFKPFRAFHLLDDIPYLKALVYRATVKAHPDHATVVWSATLTSQDLIRGQLQAFRTEHLNV